MSKAHSADTPSKARMLGWEGNGMEAQDEWSHRECQAYCRRCAAPLVSNGLVERRIGLKSKATSLIGVEKAGCASEPAVKQGVLNAVTYCR